MHARGRERRSKENDGEERRIEARGRMNEERRKERRRERREEENILDREKEGGENERKKERKRRRERELCLTESTIPRNASSSKLQRRSMQNITTFDTKKVR